MFRCLILALFLGLGLPVAGAAQSLQDVLRPHAEEVLQPGRRSVGIVIDDLVASGLPQALPFLEAWRDREIVRRDSDGTFLRQTGRGASLKFLDLDTGAEVELEEGATVTEARPNGGVRRAIGDALVQFQLSDPDITRRKAALDAIACSMDFTVSSATVECSVSIRSQSKPQPAIASALSEPGIVTHRPICARPSANAALNAFLGSFMPNSPISLVLHIIASPDEGKEKRLF